jgi:hypothetical protein
MGIASQVLEDRIGPTEGRLGIDDPFDMPSLIQQPTEGRGSAEGLQGAREAEASVLEGFGKQGQELAPEESAQHSDRQEEVGRGSDPTGSVRGQASGRHDAVQMRMVMEGLAPGMEYGQEPDLGPEMAGVGRDLQEGPGGRLEEEAIDDPGVLKCQRGQELRQGEHDVEIGDGQQMRLLGLEPLGRLAALALGTVPVPTGVVGDLLCAAVVTFLDMASQGAGPALDHGPQDTGLVERGAVAFPVGLTVAAGDLGDLQPRPTTHPTGVGGLRSSSRSRRLMVSRTRRVDTWV